MPTLDFKGKPFVYSHHLSVPFRELIIDCDKSLPSEGSAPCLDDNLIIHGDNLEALKALLPRYAGKMDVIYIDPPYNTGNEGWAYNDNVNAPALKAWLGKTVDADDLERHDKWLSMMWPRLQILKDLLSPDGFLLISIDDEEQARLLSISIEIFGEKNFVSMLVWKSRASEDTRSLTGVSNDHEYVLVFRNGELGRLRGSERDVAKFSNPDNDARGPWRSADLTGLATADKRPNLHYDLVNTKTGISYDCPAKGWRFEKATMQAKVDDGRILWPSERTGRPRHKLFLSDIQSQYKTLSSVVTSYTTGHGTRELNEILGSGEFDFPKPSGFIGFLIEQTADANAIVLDSFAGSGTTAHAVLALNKADGGNRRFILVETEGYADTLTAERVRRVIKGVPDAKDHALKAGLGGSFTYCELGEPMDLERFFAGEGEAPKLDAVARYVAWTATGETLAPADGPDGFVGHAGHYRLHLLYKPDSKWMRSNEAMLDLTTAERIAAAAKVDGGKPTLVFAAGKLMGQRVLTGLGLIFCQLPYSVHRILGEGVEGVAGVDAA